MEASERKGTPQHHHPIDFDIYHQNCQARTFGTTFLYTIEVISMDVRSRMEQKSISLLYHFNLCCTPPRPSNDEASCTTFCQMEYTRQPSTKENGTHAHVYTDL